MKGVFKRTRRKRNLERCFRKRPLSGGVTDEHKTEKNWNLRKLEEEKIGKLDNLRRKTRKGNRAGRKESNDDSRKWEAH